MEGLGLPSQEISYLLTKLQHISLSHSGGFDYKCRLCWHCFCPLQEYIIPDNSELNRGHLEWSLQLFSRTSLWNNWSAMAGEVALCHSEKTRQVSNLQSEGRQNNQGQRKRSGALDCREWYKGKLVNFLEITWKRAQVVHLVRDPRAVLSSRAVNRWDKHSLQAGPLCHQMLGDMALAKSLPPERCYLGNPQTVGNIASGTHWWGMKTW